MATKRMSTADPLKSKREEVYSNLLGRIPKEFMEVKRAMQRRFKGNGKLSSVGLPENIAYTIEAIQRATSAADLDQVQRLVKNDAFKRLPKAELKSQLLRAAGGGGSGTGAVSGTGGSATGRRRAPSSLLEEDDCSKELQKLKEQLREVKERLLDVGGQDGLDKCGKTVEKLRISIKNRDERYNIIWRKLNKVEAENEALREKAAGAGSKVSGDMVPRNKHDDALERIIKLKDKNGQLEVENGKLKAANKAMGKSVGEKVGRGITFADIIGETKTGEILPDERIARLKKKLSDSEEQLRIVRKNLEERCKAGDNQEEDFIREIEDCKERLEKVEQTLAQTEAELAECITGGQTLVEQVEDAKEIIDEKEQEIEKLKSEKRSIRQQLQTARIALGRAQQEVEGIVTALDDERDNNIGLSTEIDKLEDNLKQVTQALQECEDRYLFDDEYEDDDFEPDDDLKYYSDADDRSSARRRLEYPEDSSEATNKGNVQVGTILTNENKNTFKEVTEIKETSGKITSYKTKNLLEPERKPYYVKFTDIKNYYISSKKEVEAYKKKMPERAKEIATINRRKRRSSRQDSAGAGSGGPARGTRSQTQTKKSLRRKKTALRVVSYEGVAGEVPALPLLRIPEPHEL